MVSKRLLIAVFVACFYAIGMAVFGFFIGVEREYLWLCAVSIVMIIAMARYANDIFGDAQEHDPEETEN